MSRFPLHRRSRRQKNPSEDNRMGHFFQKRNDLPMEGGCDSYHVDLMKDSKHICRIVCINPPIRVPSPLIISDFKKKASCFWQTDLPHFPLRLAAVSEFQINEWKIFTDYLHKYDKAACAPIESGVLYILPLEPDTESGDVEAFYLCKTGTSDLNETITESKHVRCSESLMPKPEVCGSRKMGVVASISCRNAETVDLPRETTPTTPTPTSVMSEEIGDSFDVNAKGRDCNTCVVKSMDKNYIRADPSYLRTLGQTHSGWIFGAIAELVDNSRDARASKLEISIETLYSRRHSKEIPVLSVFDDGHGMSHEEIVTMLSLGRKAPDVDDIDRIGRFGIGFKSGAMRIGRDAIVLTQTSKSRSIAFLSHSLNDGKDNLEIPIISYCRQGSVMEVDTSVQSEASAGYHLKVIKEYSLFNEYLIGEKLAKFREKGTGTQIYIWNLDEWGSDYFLEWQNGKSPSHVSDILIRSRRIRSRPGQISLKVPLDYSLRSYLEVIFLEPRLKIYVQGSLVKSRPLAKSLNKTTRIKGDILGKPVQLTLGRSKLEWEQMNCGIFLYWHGRLIEAYKRVGSMVHNADIGRGVIGVIDVTDLMNDGKQVWVHNDKQGFQDCEAYAKLEDWLGGKTDAYWDDHFDTVFVEKSNETYEPDNEWVQCDKCRKWRILTSGYDSSTLPQEWFCCMPPYNGKCDIPEQQVSSDVITVAANRSGCDSKRKLALCGDTVKEIERKLVCDGNSDHSSETGEKKVFKRLRKGGVRGPGVKVNMRKP